MKIRYFIEYAPIYLLSKFLPLLPRTSAEKCGRCVGGLLYHLWPSRRKMTMENISMALGLQSGEAKKLSRCVFKHLGLTLVEMLRLPALTDRFIEEQIAVEGYENYLEAKAEGKGVLLLAAHLGNWELMGAAHCRKGEALHVVYKKPKNPYVDRFIYGLRKRSGIETIPHRNAAKKIFAALKKGEDVGILLDQHTLAKEAMIIDFFGQPAATNYGLALIALKTGAPVVPIFLVRAKGGGYRCIYEKPIYLTKSEDLKKDRKRATITFTKIIEEKIREYPEQWFWLHDRWKAKRKGKVTAYD